MTIRGVIFDMDGTITAPYLDFARIKVESGIGDVDMLDYLRRATGAEHERVHTILTKFEESGVAGAKLNLGARTVLRFLAQHKIPTALLSRNSRRSVEGVCRKLDLRFDIVITREDGPHKPAPDSILQIARRWDMSPNEVLMIGDYKWDVFCAKNAGAPCVVLVNGGDVPDWAREADFVITKLGDVIKIVEGLAPTKPLRRTARSGCAGARPSKGRTR